MVPFPNTSFFQPGPFIVLKLGPNVKGQKERVLDEGYDPQPLSVERLTDTDCPPQFSITFDLGQKKNSDEQEVSHELLTVPREKKRRREKDLSRAQPFLPWDLVFLIRKSIQESFTRHNGRLSYLKFQTRSWKDIPLCRQL
ncbi:unnamed protein product [Paramecium sonneborni]|uniref:Uncharacterized protein n=1 Tax=Paramecium sonneborni TaxID=65129 RepID=A0A8S1RAU2_9CILI|nr:unnamed protein product [Paramecium sonneborni]